MNAQVESLLEAAPPDSEELAAPALASVLGRLDLLLGRAVRAAAEKFGSVPSGDPFRGLYVSDADASRLVERGIEPLAQRLLYDLPIVDLDAAGSRWRRLAEAFDLSPAEIDVVALALAADVDLRYERIFGYLHDDVTRRRPTVDLVIQLLCRSLGRAAGGAAAVLAGCTARSHRGASPGVRCSPGLSRRPLATLVKLDEAVVDFLLGHDACRSEARRGCALGSPSQLATPGHRSPRDRAPHYQPRGRAGSRH